MYHYKTVLLQDQFVNNLAIVVLCFIFEAPLLLQHCWLIIRNDMWPEKGQTAAVQTGFPKEVFVDSV